MSTPSVYYSSNAQAAADLKLVTQRVRAKRPDLFAEKVSKETFQDGNGNVTTKDVRYVTAIAMTPAQRHAFAMRRGR